eukprot:4566962-Pleurochrysis_carterae.AAC.6
MAIPILANIVISKQIFTHEAASFVRRFEHRQEVRKSRYEALFCGSGRASHIFSVRRRVSPSRRSS